MVWGKLGYTGNSIHLLQFTHRTLKCDHFFVVVVLLPFVPLPCNPCYQNFPTSNSKIRKMVDVCAKQKQNKPMSHFKVL